MPSFVVLLHETPPGYARATHFDLMLECGAGLLTWAVPELPTRNTPMEADRLPDHRPVYLEFEGPLSGDRGVVRPVASGEFDWIEHQPTRIVVQLRGESLRGRLVIEQADSAGHRWRVVLSD
jgi:hypothetical protein